MGAYVLHFANAPEFFRNRGHPAMCVEKLSTALSLYMNPIPRIWMLRDPALGLRSFWYITDKLDVYLSTSPHIQ